MSCYTREQIEAAVKAKGYAWFEGAKDFDAVSYTHLTLPTILRV